MKPAIWNPKRVIKNNGTEPVTFRLATINLTGALIELKYMKIGSDSVAKTVSTSNYISIIDLHTFTISPYLIDIEVGRYDIRMEFTLQGKLKQTYIIGQAEIRR